MSNNIVNIQDRINYQSRYLKTAEINVELNKEIKQLKIYRSAFFILIAIIFITPLFASASNCDLKLYNKTNEPYTDQDFSVVRAAQKRCPELYKESCLTKFIKVSKLNYHAVCKRR